MSFSDHIESWVALHSSRTSYDALLTV